MISSTPTNLQHPRWPTKWVLTEAFDADEQVIMPLVAAAKNVVDPSEANRRLPPEYDHHIYQARHLVENFFTADSSSSAPSQRATTRPPGNFIAASAPHRRNRLAQLKDTP